MGAGVRQENWQLLSFRRWVGGVRGLVPGDDVFWSQVLYCWDNALESPWRVRDWYRGSGFGDGLEPAVWCVLGPCLGHHLNRGLLLRFPRLAALYAGMFVGERWRPGEDSIGCDGVACCLYARVLGGRLPDALHNRMVLEGDSRWVGVYGDFLGGS